VTREDHDFRTLLVAGDVFVDFLKDPGDLRRTFSVANPLPTDAVLMGIGIRESTRQVELLIASKLWGDTPLGVLDSPTVFVHYPEPSQS